MTVLLAEDDGYVCSHCQRNRCHRCTEPACRCCQGVPEGDDVALAPPAGFEPAPVALLGSRLYPLGYGGICFL